MKRPPFEDLFLKNLLFNNNQFDASGQLEINGRSFKHSTSSNKKQEKIKQKKTIIIKPYTLMSLVITTKKFKKIHIDYNISEK